MVVLYFLLFAAFVIFDFSLDKCVEMRYNKSSMRARYNPDAKTIKLSIKELFIWTHKYCKLQTQND